MDFKAAVPVHQKQPPLKERVRVFLDANKDRILFSWLPLLAYAGAFVILGLFRDHLPKTFYQYIDLLFRNPQ